jgi:glutamine synthetase adenylyltransferase
MYGLLKLPFRNPRRAKREVAGLVRHLPEPLREAFGTLLASSPDPEQGLHYCTRMCERQPAAFGRLIRSPDGMRHLIGVFTHSHFLSEEIVDNPEWSQQLLDSASLQRVATFEDLKDRLAAALPPGVPPDVDLARILRRQILSIMMRDIFGYGTLPEITGELTALAGAILDVT